MLVRQALVAQPALPRFVRPGDSFEAGLIGRVVEGPGGTGRAAIAAEGLSLQGAAEQRFAWEKNLPARLAFQASAGEPAPGKSSVKLRFSLARDADQAADNVEIELPVKPDRPPLRQHQIADIAAGGRADFPAPKAGVRPGSYERTLTLAADSFADPSYRRPQISRRISLRLYGATHRACLFGAGGQALCAAACGGGS